MGSRVLEQVNATQSDDTPSAAVQVLWEELPLEIFLHIFPYLSPKDVLSFLLVSKTLHSYAKNYYQEYYRSLVHTIFAEKSKWDIAGLPPHIPSWYVAYKMVVPTESQTTSLARKMVFLVDMDDLATFKASYGEQISQHLACKDKDDFTCFHAKSYHAHVPNREIPFIFNEVFYRAASLKRQNFLDYFYSIPIQLNRRQDFGNELTIQRDNAYGMLLRSIIFHQPKEEVIAKLKLHGNQLFARYQNQNISVGMSHRHIESALAVAILANNLMAIPLLIRFQGWHASAQAKSLCQVKAMEAFDLINFSKEDVVALAKAGVCELLKYEPEYTHVYHLLLGHNLFLPPLRNNFLITDNYQCVHCDTLACQCGCFYKPVGLYGLAAYAGTLEMVNLLDEIFIIKNIKGLNWVQICNFAIKSHHYDVLSYLLSYAQENDARINSAYIINQILQEPPHLIQSGLSSYQQYIVPAIHADSTELINNNELIKNLLPALMKFTCHEALKGQIYQSLIDKCRISFEKNEIFVAKDIYNYDAFIFTQALSQLFKGSYLKAMQFLINWESADFSHNHQFCIKELMPQLCEVMIINNCSADIERILYYEPSLVNHALRLAVDHNNMEVLRNLVVFIKRESFHKYLNDADLVSLNRRAIRENKIMAAILIMKLNYKLVVDALYFTFSNGEKESFLNILRSINFNDRDLKLDINSQFVITEQIRRILQLALGYHQFDIARDICVFSPTIIPYALYSVHANHEPFAFLLGLLGELSTNSQIDIHLKQILQCALQYNGMQTVADILNFRPGIIKSYFSMAASGDGEMASLFLQKRHEINLAEPAKSLIDDAIREALVNAVNSGNLDMIKTILRYNPSLYMLALEAMIASKNNDILEQHREKINSDNYFHLFDKAIEVDNCFAVNLMLADFLIYASPLSIEAMASFIKLIHFAKSHHQLVPVIIIDYYRLISSQNLTLMHAQQLASCKNEILSLACTLDAEHTASQDTEMLLNQALRYIENVDLTDELMLAQENGDVAEQAGSNVTGQEYSDTFGQTNNSDVAEQAHNNNPLSYYGFVGAMFSPSACHDEMANSPVLGDDETFKFLAQSNDETPCHVDKRPRY